MDETEKTWRKMETQIKTVGLGDGLSVGKESSFQNHFDKGFFEGFHVAYSIGKYKGILFSTCVQESTPFCENELLKQPKLAWCAACNDENLLKKKIVDYAEHQSDRCKTNLQELRFLYTNTD